MANSWLSVTAADARRYARQSVGRQLCSGACRCPWLGRSALQRGDRSRSDGRFGRDVAADRAGAGRHFGRRSAAPRCKARSLSAVTTGSLCHARRRAALRTRRRALDAGRQPPCRQPIPRAVREGGNTVGAGTTAGLVGADRTQWPRGRGDCGEARSRRRIPRGPHRREQRARAHPCRVA